MLIEKVNVGLLVGVGKHFTIASGMAFIEIEGIYQHLLG